MKSCVPIKTLNSLIEIWYTNTNTTINEKEIEPHIVFTKQITFSMNFQANLYLKDEKEKMNLCKIITQSTNNNYFVIKYSCKRENEQEFLMHLEIILQEKQDINRLYICEII